MPRRRNHAIWLGALITPVGMLSYFMYFYQFPSLRDFPWLNLSLVGLGLLLSFAGVRRAFGAASPYGGKIAASSGLVWSLLLALLFNSYVFFLSYQLPEETGITRSLSAAPDFTLKNQRGEPVSLSDYRGRKVVLTFYRGHW